MHLEASRWCRSVDALRQRDEGHPQGVQLFEKQDQMPKVAPETVEPPADEDVEPPPLGVAQEPVERGPAVCRSAHTFIDILLSRPATDLDVLPKFSELILRCLVLRPSSPW